MKRALIALCLFAPAVITGISIWTVRSTHAADVHVQGQTGTSSHIVIPAGTYLRVKLVQAISHASKPGNLIQAVTVDPLFVDAHLAIPADTRAAVHIGDIRKRSKDLAQVPVQLRQLIFTDRTLAVHSAPVLATLPRVSDLDIMSHAAEGMLGGAIGAAGGATLRDDPSLGASAVGGMAAGQETGEKNAGLLRFQIVEPIDLTGVPW